MACNRFTPLSDGCTTTVPRSTLCSLSTKTTCSTAGGEGEEAAASSPMSDARAPFGFRGGRHGLQGLMPNQPDTTAAKRGNCCICHRMQVDSLLYRCGHVCTCFDCAGQLKSSGRSCPICQTPIDDVFRAQLNF
ncbi:hypothetical protein Zm00014a_042378 [Zea mays]|uniref:RING-type domain-containing protein n=1 Tax=Zea mays TaxID=4577 RepID=A0A3L6G1J1_MAIZE|nr:hypothetical protein Zm00014a_042378 [Zea mays]